MNQLCEKFPDQLAVLAFACNQFGHQNNANNEEEMVNSLAHVRPGGGFQFLGEMFDRVEVNGEKEDPIFTLLKTCLPVPHDLKDRLMGSPHYVIWGPVKRSDISWNFEKFLIGPDGTPLRRYSNRFITEDLEEDIAAVLSGSSLSESD